jgi:hypothetical protein
MAVATQSAVVIFDMTVDEARQRCMFRYYVDGVYQETRSLDPNERTISGLHAPAGALVRIELIDDADRVAQQCSFTALRERRTIEHDGLTIQIRGDLFEAASQAS